MKCFARHASAPLAAALATLLGIAPMLVSVVFAAASDSAGIRLTVAGDSLALGIGASDSARGFAFDLFERLRSERPTSEVTNLAIGGATAEDVVRLELPRIRETRPTIVLLEVGANDVIRRHPVAAFARDYRTLVDGVRRSAPGARIVLFNVPDVSVSPIFERPSKPALHRLALAYNAIVTEESRRIAAPVVDLFAFSKRATTDPARYFSTDQFHPSDDGHAAIADAAWPIVRSVAQAALVRRPVRAKSYSVRASERARSSSAGSRSKSDHMR